MKPQISTRLSYDENYENDCWGYLAENWLEQIAPDELERNFIASDAECGHPVQTIRFALGRAFRRGIDIPEYYLQAIEKVMEASILTKVIAKIRARPGHQLEGA